MRVAIGHHHHLSDPPRPSSATIRYIPVALLFFLGCASVPLLDESVVRGGGFTVAEVSILVLPGDYSPGMEKRLLQEEIPRVMADLQEYCRREWGFELETEAYAQALADPQSFTINRRRLYLEKPVAEYAWRSKVPAESSASLRIPLSVEGGAMNMRLVLRAPQKEGSKQLLARVFTYPLRLQGAGAQSPNQAENRQDH
jgi:hypothetical protein